MTIDSPESTTTVEYVLRGRPGRVVIRYGLNDEPSRWGYNLLGIKSLVEGSRGFPVVTAEVETAAEGYAGVMSWIQMVWMKDLDGEGPEELVFDRAPQLLDLDLPYVSFGARPVFFDAPSIDASNVDWDAQAFLTYTPDCLMTRVVKRLCGFSWGYRLRDRRPTSVPLCETGTTEWSAACPLLRARFQSWTFEEG
jgi:hypothetical protein